jgi:hypothetical protein
MAGDRADGEWDLRQSVEELNRAAFDLARQAAADPDSFSELEPRARQMNRFLDELVPLIQAAAPTDQPSLQAQWTEARQDVLYLLSSGRGPTSLRLYHFLQSRK